MTKRVKVTGVSNEKPDVRLYALALIALARQIQDEREAEEGRVELAERSRQEVRSA